ncbi:MAG: alpha/beta fold hydrolase, partial [Litoreibacter sp.]|nr:alpha/beta fold hydrolase [Litoreibacter sp.]
HAADDADLTAPVIVLIHGLGLSRHMWRDHLPALTRSHTVLSYDLYGHGDSAPPSGVASLGVYATQIRILMDHLGIGRAAVVGFSIGGMINRRFALDHPERLAALAILNSPHDRGDEGQKLVEERAAKVREKGAFSTFDEALARWFTPAFRENAPDVMALVRDWRGQVDPESYAQAAWVLANGVRELIRPDPPITAPTLVMTCENDSGSTPAMSHAIASETDGAQTIIVPRLQHLGLMEDPDAFTTPILDSLERTPQ